MIGEILGNRYELLEKIGEGGMAQVYKARCNKLNRFVAVKILKNEFCDNEDIINKFKREATAIATLSDNNIVNVLDVGSQDDMNYIVMEYVKGKTLKEFIKQFGKLNYESAVTIGIQIGRALDCAHKNNIIHRDVKPQNILVTEEGIIKVTDFGIAKSASSATLTNTTTIMGSAHYFSPEQAKGSVVDNRADIYSLGVVLFEMVTGKLPFEADSPVTIALKHIQEEVVPPKTINSKIPDNLNKLIVKCMEKDPAMRYQNAREIIADLQKIKDDPNASIIEDIASDTDGHTIVMAPIKLTEKEVKKNEAVKDLEDEYYDDEDDYDDYDDEDEDRKKKKSGSKKPLIIGISVAALLLLLGLGAFFMFGGGTPANKDVEVPKITGMMPDEAKKTLEALGLIYEEGGVDISDEKEGSVIEVFPKEGSSIKEGQKVRVTLSAGKEKTEMPNLIESDRATAETILKSKDLTNYSYEEVFDDKISKGQIIKTEPVAKTEISKESKIVIYISKGPEIKYASMPKLIGLGRDEAVALLTTNNLKCTVSEEEVSDESMVGKVKSTSHPEGTKVAEGTTISIVIGKKKAEEPTVEISTLINKNMTGAQAKAILEGKGYVVKLTGDATDKVDSWDPSPAKKGATITITTKKETPTPPPTKPEAEAGANLN